MIITHRLDVYKLFLILFVIPIILGLTSSKIFGGYFLFRPDRLKFSDNVGEYDIILCRVDRGGAISSITDIRESVEGCSKEACAYSWEWSSLLYYDENSYYCQEKCLIDEVLVNRNDSHNTYRCDNFKDIILHGFENLGINTSCSQSIIKADCLISGAAALSIKRSEISVPNEIIIEASLLHDEADNDSRKFVSGKFAFDDKFTEMLDSYFYFYDVAGLEGLTALHFSFIFSGMMFLILLILALGRG